MLEEEEKARVRVLRISFSLARPVFAGMRIFGARALELIAVTHDISRIIVVADFELGHVLNEVL